MIVDVPKVLDPKHAPKREPRGAMVHTTGGGVTELARKEAMAEAKRAQAAGTAPRPTRTPIEVALDVYRSSQKKRTRDKKRYVFGGPTYVIDHDGTIYRMAPDEAQTAHCGGYDRSKYLSGAWARDRSLWKYPEGMVPTVAAWRKQWPGHASPYHLFKSTSPNVDYIGIEMIPIGDGYGGDPAGAGERFALAQYEALIWLLDALGKKHAWPAGWYNTGRLVGHEDVQPLNRHDKRGGWDPGYLRASPYFDFAHVRERLAACSAP